MIRTNAANLYVVSVVGEISPPTSRTGVQRVGYDGVARMLPGTGGITYNLRVGDPAMGGMGDHVEPCCSVKNKDDAANNMFNILSCVGNEARLISGEAKGTVGRVTGKHGGIEHVLVDFPPEKLDDLAVGDKVLVKSCGQGLEMENFPEIKVMNLDPSLMDRMGLTIEGETLVVPVTHEIPAHLMGSGIGAPAAERGDYDVTTQDKEALADLRLDELRLGDIVAIHDRSSFYGRSYRRGAIEIGVVVHADSYISGHGPGITTLLTANAPGKICPVIDRNANIARYLGLREDL